MGIDICDKRVVTLNEAHELRLVTNVDRNPVTSKLKKFVVKSVYRRTKDGDTERDGNPFIYALKRANNYSITSRELYRFRPSFKEILAKMHTGTDINYVVGMPSSHNIVAHFGKRIARAANATYIDDYFVKRTVGSQLEIFDHSRVKRQHQSQVDRVLATYAKLSPDEPMSLKKVKNKVRHYFDPVIENPDYTGVKLTGNVLFVDDLLSTGTTLQSAKTKIDRNHANVLGGYCLLSDL